MSALDMIDGLIANLEADLGLPAGGLPASTPVPPPANKKRTNKKAAKKAAAKGKESQKQAAGKGKPADLNMDLPPICHIEFKVGVITKVWVHPDADKLWCEEIDCGEEQPRQISSGLRPYYDEAGMMGRRLLVVANLKAKNLKGFKSHGMVLCAAESDGKGGERVQFVEPPVGAPLGEVVQFEGLTETTPASAGQVGKKKLFEAAMEKMKTNDNAEGCWDNHRFMTSAGPCKCIDIKGGVMR